MLALSIQKGATFHRVFRWESGPIVYAPITDIAQSAPAVITAPSHGLVDGWRVAVVSVQGMDEINAKNDPPKSKDYRRVTVIDIDTVELNEVNAADYGAYVSGGYLRYNTPVNLQGMTARMAIKNRIGGTVLETLTTENGKIELDNSAKTITLNLSAMTTAAYTWATGVYDLELVALSGAVTKLASGGVSVSPEVTT